MKINISNLGQIKNAQIDLKPFTVFVGENGTGKTWTAYAIAALLGPYGHEKYLHAYLNHELEHTYAILDDSIERLIDKGATEINLQAFISHHLAEFINAKARLIPELLVEYLATQKVSFNETQITVELMPDDVEQIIGRCYLSCQHLSPETCKTIILHM